MTTKPTTTERTRPRAPLSEPHEHAEGQNECAICDATPAPASARIPVDLGDQPERVGLFGPSYVRLTQRRGGAPIDVAQMHVCAIATAPGGTDVYTIASMFDVAEPIEEVRRKLGWE